MNKWPFLLLLLLLVSQPLTAEEKADGWKLLFDGKTLDGWKLWKTKEPLKQGGWKIQEGALSRVSKAGDIYTAGTYENFDLKLEWKSSGNSGIMIRIDGSLKGPIWRVAPEMQILNNTGTDKKSVAALYDLIAVEGDVEFKKDDWNSVRILMKDGTATHWFNGKKAYSYTIGSDDWKAMVERNQDEMVDGLGLWGVPSFRLSGPEGQPDLAVWGQDRLWLVAAEIRRRAS